MFELMYGKELLTDWCSFQMFVFVILSNVLCSAYFHCREALYDLHFHAVLSKEKALLLQLHLIHSEAQLNS